MKRLGFTLAEIMIVLMVIGILTAILLPSARNAMPNQDVMKFKKAHNALHTAIAEMVNSDKYYQDGNLGVRANGVEIDGTHDGDYSYLCVTMGEVLNAKNAKCVNEKRLGSEEGGWYRDGWGGHSSNAWWYDRYCRMHQTTKRRSILEGEGLQLDNGIVIYETRPDITFGSYYNGKKLFTEYTPNPIPETFIKNYKIICIDIDGVSNNFSWVDYYEGDEYDETKVCDGFCPFAYGVRYDGKIESGLLAQEYLDKSIQEKD